MSYTTSQWGRWILLLHIVHIAIAQDPDASRRPGRSQPWTLYSSGQSPGDKMQPGDILQVGAFLTSTNGMFMLIMQEDCNVVVYHVRKDPTTNATVSQEAIWSTGSNGGGNSCIFRLLGRGQVVVLRSMYDSRVKWHSSDRYFSDPIPPFQLMLMDDGALIVAFETDFDPAPYTVLWASR